jgi:hypothetical protein
MNESTLKEDVKPKIEMISEPLSVHPPSNEYVHTHLEPLRA